MTRPRECVGLQGLVLVYVFVFSIVVLLVVTRLAARRDAARKAALLQRDRGEADGGSGDRRS